jgi:hypothetical protein
MQNALHRGEVGLSGIMHVKAYLLNNVGDIGVCEHQVLSQISNRRHRLSRDLGLCVHGHRNRLAVHYAITLNDIKSILMQNQEEHVRLMLYGDS